MQCGGVAEYRGVGRGKEHQPCLTVPTGDAGDVVLWSVVLTPNSSFAGPTYNMVRRCTNHHITHPHTSTQTLVVAPEFGLSLRNGTVTTTNGVVTVGNGECYRVVVCVCVYSAVYAVCGVRCAVCGVRCAVCGVRCAVDGVRCVVCACACAVHVCVRCKLLHSPVVHHFVFCQLTTVQVVATRT